MHAPESALSVLIDEGMSTSRFLTGIGHHSVSLANAMRAHASCRLSDYGLIRFIPRVFRRFMYLLVVNLSTPFRSAEVVHFQNYYVPRFRGSKIVVVTIQDLSSFRYPETLTPLYRRYARSAVRNAVVRADLIILPMESVRAELHDIIPDSRTRRTEVVPDGLRDSFRVTAAMPGGPLPSGLQPNSFFLTVGTIERRKNLAVLVRAFLEWRSEAAIDSGFKLVLAGKEGFGSEEILGLAGSTGPVLHLSGLTDADLVALYRNCRAVVFPSLYEGFGLPLLEAMSQGARIVASDIPTTLEMNAAHGGQFLLFGKERPDELKRSMQTAYHEGAGLRRRIDYGDLGPYSYDSIARRHVQLYRSIRKDRSHA